MAADSIQPPAIQWTRLLSAPNFLPRPKGSSTTGAMMTRCGTSIRL